MICPQCGYDIGSSHKCLRCGYEVKTLVSVAEDEKKDEKKDDTVTKVIDPRNVYLSNPNDYDDDPFEDPFSMLFGDIFSPIESLLGGLFGFDVRPPRQSVFRDEIEEEEEEDDAPKKKEGPVVEVKKVEILDENGDPVKQDGPIKKTVNKVKNKFKKRDK